MSSKRAEILILAKMRDEASRVMEGMAGNIERNAGKIRKAGLVMAAAGAALSAFLIVAAKSALEEERGVARLDLVLKKVGSSYDQVGVALEKEIRATQLATGVGDELQREILGKLIPILGSYEQAIASLPLILDTMAAGSVGADTAIRGMGRALAGQVNLAASVGIQFEKTANFSDRLAFALSKIGGQAEVMKDPFSAAAGAVGDLAQAIAKPLTGPLKDALNWIEKVTLGMSDMDPVLAKVVAIAVTGAAAFATFAGAFLLLAPTIAKSLVILKSMAGVMAVLRALTGPTGIAIALASVGVGLAVNAAVQSFQKGGVVAGPVGSAQLAIVHGGETVIPVGGRGGGGDTININFPQGSTVLLDDRGAMKLGAIISDAQRRRARGTVGVSP